MLVSQPFWAPGCHRRDRCLMCYHPAALCCISDKLLESIAWVFVKNSVRVLTAPPAPQTWPGRRSGSWSSWKPVPSKSHRFLSSPTRHVHPCQCQDSREGGEEVREEKSGNRTWLLAAGYHQVGSPAASQPQPRWGREEDWEWWPLSSIWVCTGSCLWINILNLKGL